MKINMLILFTLIVTACTFKSKTALEKFLATNLQPTEKQVNKLNIGETITFGVSSRSGVDEGRYPPAKTYGQHIDNKYFEYIKTEHFADGAAGGYSYNYEVYRAIKTGSTNIIAYAITNTSAIKAVPAGNQSVQYIDSINSIKPVEEITSTYQFVIR